MTSTRGTTLQQMTSSWEMNQVLDFPRVPVRKHVLWLPIDRQGTVNYVSLSAELENFAEYVKVSKFAEYETLKQCRYDYGIEILFETSWMTWR